MVKALRWFAVGWACLVAGLVLLAIVAHVLAAPSFWRGLWEVAGWFSPFNFWNWGLTLVLLSPALGALWLAQRLNQAKASGRKPNYGSSQTSGPTARKPAHWVDKPLPPGGNVLDGPAWVDGAIVRVVSVDGMAKTEVWTPGVGWTPSGIHPAEVLMAPPAPDPEKEAIG